MTTTMMMHRDNNDNNDDDVFGFRLSALSSEMTVTVDRGRHKCIR